MTRKEKTTVGSRCTTRRHDRRRHSSSLMEKEAARRAYCGNGMSGTLPPLPCANDEDEDEDGCSTLFGHPYGALPHGNIHLSSSAGDRDVRRRGLGQLLCACNDEQLLHVLSYLDGSTLAMGVVQCSHYLYVLGHHEEVWRDLVLRRWGHVGFTVPEQEKRSGMRNNNKGCWKDIYAYNHHHQQQQKQQQHERHSNILARHHPTTTHTPIVMAGIYSDTLYRSWLCRSFTMRKSWLATQTVPTLPHSVMTTDLFIREYENKNIPLVIQGATRTWKAVRTWDDTYLRNVTSSSSSSGGDIDSIQQQQQQNVMFRATSGAAPLPAQFTMSNYLNYCSCATEESPLYLFDRSYASKCTQLYTDHYADLCRTCPWWDGGATNIHGHDLFGLLGEMRRPDYQWLIVGPMRSGSNFHIDPNCTHAWNAPIIGRKRWIFYPPGATPPGVFPSTNGDDVCMPISIGEWFLTYWNEHVGRRSDVDVGKRPLECTVCPGDILFIPHGWWHMVINIGDEDDDDNENDNGRRRSSGASVALTRNYVSASNLPDVLRFLDTRIGQISGCRDRLGEGAIAPEDLGREFRNAMLLGEEDVFMTTVEEGQNQNEEDVACDDEKKCDGDDGARCVHMTRRRTTGIWADLLIKSEARAKEGWSCDAWTDLPSPSRAATTTAKLSTDNDDRRTMKSSILSRAKRPASALYESDGQGGGDAAVVLSSSTTDGFSFSFL